MAKPPRPRDDERPGTGGLRPIPQGKWMNVSGPFTERWVWVDEETGAMSRLRSSGGMGAIPWWMYPVAWSVGGLVGWGFASVGGGASVLGTLFGLGVGGHGSSVGGQLAIGLTLGSLGRTVVSSISSRITAAAGRALGATGEAVFDLTRSGVVVTYGYWRGVTAGGMRAVADWLSRLAMP